MMMRTPIVLLLAAMALPAAAQQALVDDGLNAQTLQMKARFLNGHQPSTSPPGIQQHQLNARRGGPHAAHYQEAGCGGVAIGNVHPVAGDHRPHKTTILIHGHVYNGNNRCN